MHEFKAFRKINKIENLYVRITQKLHGTNVGIYRYVDESRNQNIKAASRTRFITSNDDHYGFARYVEDNREEFLKFFEHGWHYGEWVGPGINNGEGLKEKQFALFSPPERYKIPYEVLATKQVIFVPLLYEGLYNDLSKLITEIMAALKEWGSCLVEGFMKPEGIVIELDGRLYKKTFDQETSPWKAKKIRQTPGLVDVNHLLQPLRLEKLLSKDEKFRREYPHSLSTIASMYVQDLIEENQITGTEEEIRLIKKSLGRKVFKFIKSQIQGE